MTLLPSHSSAIIGGVWTALGFVPFDVWLGRAQPVSQQFLPIEVTAADVAAIEKRGEFSTRLVDHWNEE